MPKHLEIYTGCPRSGVRFENVQFLKQLNQLCYSYLNVFNAVFNADWKLNLYSALRNT